MGEQSIPDGWRLLGTRDGRSYWSNPADGYVYQQLPDGSLNGWICTMVLWETWLRLGWAVD